MNYNELENIPSIFESEYVQTSYRNFNHDQVIAGSWKEKLIVLANLVLQSLIAYGSFYFIQMKCGIQSYFCLILALLSGLVSLIYVFVKRQHPKKHLFGIIVCVSMLTLVVMIPILYFAIFYRDHTLCYQGICDEQIFPLNKVIKFIKKDKTRFLSCKALNDKYDGDISNIQCEIESYVSISISELCPACKNVKIYIFEQMSSVIAVSAYEVALLIVLVVQVKDLGKLDELNKQIKYTQYYSAQ